jgi:hypothetical protein
MNSSNSTTAGANSGVAGLKRLLRRTYWRLWAAQRNYKIERHARAGPWQQPNPLRVLNLRPSDVVGHTNFQPATERRELRNRVFGQEVLPGSVIGGDWDLNCPPFEELAAYQSIYARIHQQAPWRSSAYFAESMRDIRAGRPLWNCHNADQLEQRLAYVDGLISSIRSHGLLLQSQVGRAQDPTGRYSDELEVNVGRDGRFLFQDGRHRLCVAKALGLTNITVKVRVRHPMWLETRHQLLDLVAKTGLLPHTAPHPDLDDIPAAATWPDLAQALQRELRPGTHVLDLQARLGSCSHLANSHGVHTTAIELDTQWAALATTLRNARGLPFVLCSNPAAVRALVQSQRFDTGLLMAGPAAWRPDEGNERNGGHDLALQAALNSQHVQRWLIALPTPQQSQGRALALPAPLARAVASGHLSSPVVAQQCGSGCSIVALNRL